MSTANSFRSVAIVDYPDAQQAAVFGLEDLFTLANRHSMSRGGLCLDVQRLSLSQMSPAFSANYDIVILPPSLTSQRGRTFSEAYDWLYDQHKNGAVMCSICAGVFWLGYAGLLNARPVTTHWMLAEEIGQVFPEAQVNAQHILIDDNDIVTAGGLMAWVDLGLFVVARELGAEITSLTARHLLVDPSGREQRNYRSFRPILTHGDIPILRIQHYLEKAYAETLTVRILAEQAGLSQRTFMRRFKSATGRPPNSYIQDLRIEKARGLLERTRLSVSEVAWQSGYHDVSAFSRIFREKTGLTAGRYRERFRVDGAYKKPAQ